MSKATVIFSHGHESSPESRKIVELAPIAEGLGYSTVAIDYRDLRDDPVARSQRLVEHIDQAETPPVLVGSSMGGWVSMNAAEQRPIAGLYLLAPALFMEDHVDGGEVPDSYQPQTGRVCVVHGWNDEIIDWQRSLRFAERSNASLHILDAGHRLEEQLALIKVLFRDFLAR